MSALVLSELRFGYVRRREVLHGVSAEMPAGRLTCVVGPNGCGKTTLLTCVNRINRLWSGSVVLEGTALPEGGACPEGAPAGAAGGEPHEGVRRAEGRRGAARIDGSGCESSRVTVCPDPGARPEVTPASAVRSTPTDLLACPLPQLARLVGYVPQRAAGELSGSVVDYLLLGRRQRLSWSLAPEDLEAVAGVLARLGIGHLADAAFAELSGGERQKVVIARALLQEPRVLLLDEPTASLDIRNQREILDLAAALAHDEGRVVVAVLHDLSAALRYADQVVLMREGSVVAAGTPAEVLTPRAVEAVYGTPVRIDAGGYVNPFA